MESIILRVDHEVFELRIKKEADTRYSGSVIEVIETYEKKIFYRSNTSCDMTGKIEEARVWFDWSFCSRGVWEGRVYFKDSEYWSEEMETISDLWNQIEKIAKQKIKNNDPTRDWSLQD